MCRSSMPCSDFLGIRSSGYRTMVRDQKPDMLGSMPPEILRRIASFLPLKEAVRTSTLGSSWKHLWTPSQADSDVRPIEMATAEAIIGKFLATHDFPEVRKLCFGPTENDQELVMVKGAANRELCLQFCRSKAGNPRTGKRYNLILELGSSGRRCLDGFASLRVLHLRSVDFKSENLVSNLFQNLELLKSLEVEGSGGLRFLEISDRSKQLRSLKIKGCWDIEEVNVSAPNLRVLSYSGRLPRIEMKRIPTLAAAVLDLRDGLCPNSEFDCEEVLSLLESMKEVEALTVSGWLLEWLCSAGVIFGMLGFQFGKLRELRWVDRTIDRQKQDSLSCFLNMCPSLESLLIKIDPDRTPVPPPCFHQYWHEPHLWMVCTATTSSAVALKNVKTVEFVGFTGEEDQLKFVDLILENATALESMVVV